MRCWPTLVLIGLAGALAPAAGAADGADVPAAAQAAYLRDRDASALLERSEDASPGWRALAILSLDRLPPVVRPDATGVDALPSVVLALRSLDLGGAQGALRAAGSGRGRIGAWLQALLHLRRGDDSGAVGALLAPPLFAWQQDAFTLALVGAALHRADRRLLAAGARAALARAAERGRIAAVRAVALAAVAVDPESAPRALTFAVRVLRRMGEEGEAARLLAAAPQVGVPVRGALALEAALLAWQQGRGNAVAGLLAESPPEGLAGPWLALRRARRRPRVPRLKGWRHEPGRRAQAAAVARLVTILGRRTSSAEVQSWARRAQRLSWHAGAPRAYLESKRFAVVSVAGSPAAGDAMLKAGLPFLFFRLAPGPRAWQERPVVVRSYDRHTGLWLLDAPDGAQVDVMPRQAASKGRMLCAAPLGQQAVMASLKRLPGARMGRLLESALDAADRGELEAAVAALGPARAAMPAAQALYRAHVLHRSALEARDNAALRAAGQQVERLRRVAPAVGLEAYLRGSVAVLDRDIVAAADAYRLAGRLDGPHVVLYLAMFAAQMAAGDGPAALKALDAARALDPLDVRVLFHRGTARAALGQPRRARDDLRRALDRRPAAVSVAVALARLEVAAGRYDGALDVLRATARHDEALAQDPMLRKAQRDAELALIENAPDVATLRQARRSSEPQTRRLLAYELAQRTAESEAAEAELRELLDDPVENVRATALKVYLRPWLRRRIEADAVLCRRVVSVLATDEAPTVRAAAAAVLARTQSDLAARGLAEALAGPKADRDPDVRGAVARALATQEGPEARTALVAALEDPALAVRSAAAASLFQIAGIDHGFDPAATPEERATGLAAWKAWLAAEGSSNR